MKKLPDVLLVIGTMSEVTAVKEAKTLKIPVMALADTNSNPDTIDYVVPANDDAVRAIKLLIGALADAILEGQQMRKPDDFGQEGGDDSSPAFANKYDDVVDDEALLGASTLAKLRNTKLFEEETEE